MAQEQLPHHQISGLDGPQADEVVELAFQTNVMRDEIIASNGADWTLEDEHNARIRANEARIGALTGRETVRIEQVPVEPSGTRPKKMQVVNPYDGRIVPYGQLAHGNHPQGGRIVGYR